MNATLQRSAWTVAPDAGTIRVRLEESPSALECYDIVDRVEIQTRRADVLVLQGPGWATPRAWKTARLLGEIAADRGVEVRLRP